MGAPDIIVNMPQSGWPEWLKWLMGIAGTVIGGGLSWLFWRKREHR